MKGWGSVEEVQGKQAIMHGTPLVRTTANEGQDGIKQGTEVTKLQESKDAGQSFVGHEIHKIWLITPEPCRERSDGEAFMNNASLFGIIRTCD